MKQQPTLLASLGRQQGLSKSGLMLIILLVALFVTVGLKLIPVYVDHNVVTGAIKTLQESGRLSSMTQSEVRQEISNSLRVNNVRDFDLAAITVLRSGNQNSVNVSYEKRLPVFSNIDIVVSFDEAF